MIFTNEELAIAHGAVLNEMASMRKLLADTENQTMIEHMRGYGVKLDALETKLREELARQAAQPIYDDGIPF